MKLNDDTKITLTLSQLKRLVSNMVVREDGEGGGFSTGGDSGCVASGCGASSAPSAPIGSIASVLTGGSPAYDDVKAGKPILGPDNFVMPGGYRGRTPKHKKRRLSVNKEIVVR